MTSRTLHVLLRRTLFALLTILILVAALMVYSYRQWRIHNDRRSDIETLTLICLNSTNIYSTDDLLRFVERNHVKLYAPDPVDPKKPCFRLVNPHLALAATDFFYPNEILLEETNIRDSDVIYVSTMDGGVATEPKSIIEQQKTSL